LADNSNVSVKLDNSKFQILNTKYSTGSAVATIDNQGNASFSGQLSSSSLNTGDATISGTLHAGRILADDIVGLHIQAATVRLNISLTSPMYIIVLLRPERRLWFDCVSSYAKYK